MPQKPGGLAWKWQTSLVPAVHWSDWPGVLSRCSGPGKEVHVNAEEELAGLDHRVQPFCLLHSKLNYLRTKNESYLFSYPCF